MKPSPWTIPFSWLTPRISYRKQKALSHCRAGLCWGDKRTTPAIPVSLEEWGSTDQQCPQQWAVPWGHPCWLGRAPWHKSRGQLCQLVRCQPRSSSSLCLLQSEQEAQANSTRPIGQFPSCWWGQTDLKAGLQISLKGTRICGRCSACFDGTSSPLMKEPAAVAGCGSWWAGTHTWSLSGTPSRNSDRTTPSPRAQFKQNRATQTLRKPQTGAFKIDLC